MQNTDDIPIIKLVEQFMNGVARNAWLENKYMKVFVRRAFHMVGTTVDNTFDIANITVKPVYQGQGYFKTLIQFVETLGLTVYVESINNIKLKEMLIKNGYTIDYTGYNAYKKFI